MSTEFNAVSSGVEAVVVSAGQSVVQVDARRRYPASGIVWSEEGVIVTANHVVRRDSVHVGLPDGRKVDAVLIGRDPSIDLAALRVKENGLAAAKWTPEEDLNLGALVVAVGRPGPRLEVSLGILSAVGGAWRTRGAGQADSFVRADLVMYPGFSGGPIVGADGRIVGMATSSLGREGGIALTKATVGPVVASLLAHGSVRWGYLGVGTQTARLPASVVEELGQETGVLLNSVESDSPAERGGLVVGDILVGLDGEKIDSPEALAIALRGNRAGRETRLQIVRGGAAREVVVELGVREELNQGG